MGSEDEGVAKERAAGIPDPRQIVGSKSLIDIRLAGGRAVWCGEYVVAETYKGFLCRSSSEESNAIMLDSAQFDAAKYFGKRWPLQVVKPIRQPDVVDYPPVRVSAFLRSFPVQHEMDLSSLVVVWFQDHLYPVPDEASRAALASLDWERHAVDWEM
jgi:hypothetical protein